MNIINTVNTVNTLSVSEHISDKILSIVNDKPLIYAGLGCLAMFTFLYINSSINRSQKTTHNQYIIHTDEVLSDVSYYTHRGDQVIHIFWNGDFYSTWLLCYYFIAAEQPVQPVFIVPSKSHKLSATVERMKQIRLLLISRYPHKKARLLPTYYITNISKNNSITYTITKIHALTPWLDPHIMNTLEQQSRFAADWPWPVLTAFIPSSQLQHAFTKSGFLLFGQWLNAHIKMPELANIRFPLLARNPTELNTISLDSKHYFYDVLLMANS